MQIDTLQIDTSQSFPVCEDQLQRLSILAQYPTLTLEFAQTIFEHAAVNGELHGIRMLRELGVITIDSNVIFHAAFEEAVKNGHVHIVRELLPDSLHLLPSVLKNGAGERLMLLFTLATTLEMWDFLFQSINCIYPYSAWLYLKNVHRNFILTSIANAIQTHNVPVLTWFLSHWMSMLTHEHFVDCCKTQNDQMIVAMCTSITPEDNGFSYSGVHINCMAIAVQHGYTAAVRILVQRIPHHVRPTFIINAIENHNSEILRILLSAKNSDGSLLLKPDFDNNLAIRTAIRRESTECIRILTEFPPHQHYIENKALVRACERGNVETVRTLLTNPNIDPSAFRNSALRTTVK